MSAYDDGNAVLQKIKNRRARKQLLPVDVTSLEESLQQSPLDIRVESQRISSSLGPTPDVGLSILDKGDESTIEGLRQVKIELRAAVYEKLVEALLTDEVDDLALALDASESGRSGTLALLSGLQRRLLGIEASPREQTLETSTSPLEQTISTLSLIHI